MAEPVPMLAAGAPARWRPWWASVVAVLLGLPAVAAVVGAVITWFTYAGGIL